MLRQAPGLGPVTDDSAFLSPTPVTSHAPAPSTASYSLVYWQDYVTYYRYVRLVQNATDPTDGHVSIDLWDATGAVSVINDAAQPLDR